MKRLQQERSISEALPHNSELWRTKYDTISAAEISFWPWPMGSSDSRTGCSRKSTDA
jgi:alpha-amylase/alpha-mannosidase (GH57 family)